MILSCRPSLRAPLLALLLAMTCACDTGPASVFHAGRQAVLDGEYASGIRQLEDYLEDRPSEDLASRAKLFIGKGHVGRGDLSAARTWFERTAREHPASLEAPKARYKLALIELVSGNEQAALERFLECASESSPLRAEAAAMARLLESR